MGNIEKRSFPKLDFMKLFFISFFSVCLGQNNVFNQANAVAHGIVKGIDVYNDLIDNANKTRLLAVSIWQNNLTDTDGGLKPLAEFKGGDWKEIGELIFDNDQLFDTVITGLQDATKETKEIIEDVCLPFNDFDWFRSKTGIDICGFNFNTWLNLIDRLKNIIDWINLNFD